MDLVNSLDTAGTLRVKKKHCDWVRTVCSESPPASMDEYLRNWEVFFDQYASQVDHWHHRNAGYHKAIASLDCDPESLSNKFLKRLKFEEVNLLNRDWKLYVQSG